MVVDGHFLVGLCRSPFPLWETEGNQESSLAAGAQAHDLDQLEAPAQVFESRGNDTKTSS